MSFPNFADMGGGDDWTLPPPETPQAPPDTAPPQNEGGGDQSNMGDVNPMYWDDAGHDAPAPSPAASYWDSQGSDTPKKQTVEAAPPEEAPPPKPTVDPSYWDSVGNAAPSGGGAGMYVSPVDYNAYEGEPPPFDIKDM